MLNKVLLAAIAVLSAITLCACAAHKETPLVDVDQAFTESVTATEETNAYSESPEDPLRHAAESTEADTTEQEVTVYVETEIVYEYKVDGGSAWVGVEMPESNDETELIGTSVVTHHVTVPVSPETEPSTAEESETKADLTTEEYFDSEPVTDEETTGECTEEAPDPEEETTASIEPEVTYPDGTYSPVAAMYHSINETPFTSLTGLFVRPTDFEDQLITLKQLGYQFIFADEFQYTSQPSVMLTFDDGYEDNYTELFPLLKKYNAKATIFMITSAIDSEGYLTKEQIVEMSESGLVRFASHTHDHPSLTSLTEDGIRYQFERSKETLEELTGQEVLAVCYPGGNVSEDIAAIAKDYFSFGYTTVSSAYTYECDPMLIPRVRVSRGITGPGLAYLIEAGTIEY